MVVSERRNAGKTETESSVIIVQIVENIFNDKNIKHIQNQSKCGINTFGNGRHYRHYQTDIIEV